MTNPNPNSLWSKGKKEGRGTIRFTNGAVYEGRFRGDHMEGQGTMKMGNNCVVKTQIKVMKKIETIQENDDDKKEDSSMHKKDQIIEETLDRTDWMIPIQFQSDMEHIHQKAGFTKGGE